MTAITWRNVEGPDFSGSTRALQFAQQSFKDAFGGAQTFLDKSADIDMANWKQGKENNTNAFLARLAQFQTPEEAQAAMASGELARELEGYGAQIDGVAARNAKMSLVENLQGKALKNQQYKDVTEEVAQRPVAADFAARIVGAKTPAEAETLIQELRGALTNNQLNPNKVIELSDKARARGQGIVKDERDSLTFAEQQKEWQRGAEKHPLEIAALKAANALKNAQATAARSGSNDPSRTQSAIEAASREHVLKQSVLGDGTIEGLDGRKAVRAHLKDTLGLSDNAIEDVIEQVYKKYPNGTFTATVKDENGVNVPVPGVPIPVRTIVEAASKSPEWLGNGSFWSRRGDTTLQDLNALLGNSEYVSQIRSSLVLRDLGAVKAVAKAGADGRAIPPGGKSTLPKK